MEQIEVKKSQRTPFLGAGGERRLLVGESLALFNYESRQEAWKIPTVLQPGTGGGEPGAVLPSKDSLSPEGVEEARGPGSGAGP